MNLIKETIYTNKLARRFAVYKINKLIMAYKQKPGRGKSNPLKAMEKYTSSPLKKNGIKEGTVLKKGGKSYEVKYVGPKQVVVSTGTGTARISSEEANKMYMASLKAEDMAKPGATDRPDVRTATSSDELELRKEEMRKSRVLTPQQETIAKFGQKHSIKE